MQKKAGLIIGAVVIAIVLAVFFLMQSLNSPTQNSNSSKDANLESTSRGSIAGLLAAGKSVNCTMIYPDDGGSGSVYVSGKKMRGDFNVVADGKAYKSSMIQDGDYMYMWSDADKKGTKFKITAASPSTTAPNTQTQNVDLNKEVDLQCSSEGVDPSKFVLPTDVEFTDMSAIMEKAQEPAGMTGAPSKSACDGITDPEAKASCQSAFGN